MEEEMIKKLKDAIKDFYNDKTPIYIKEFLIFAIFVAIVEVVMAFIIMLERNYRIIK
jgi:hypothetical protein